ncbi:hypothetical protein BurJ1DRAFT_3711 [Burkholderiales bacterium JOSHI_001]|nr:hypothetical protein BurJ1DRAFT_3711 [Burkholderiales bacterium JOSHI_001]
MTRMSDALDLRRRQLMAWQAVVDADPARHAHQGVALRRELALCRGAPSMPAYLQASDAGFECTRAAWLDQQALHLRLALTLGQPGVAQAAWQAIQQALAASGQHDWVAAVQRGATTLAQAQARQAQAEGGLLRTLLNLLPWHGGEAWQGNPWDDAVEGWRAACEADASLAVAVAQGRLASHPLALRLPWRGPALNLVQSWLQALPPPPATALPQVPDLLARQQAAQVAWTESLHAPASNPFDLAEPRWEDAPSPAAQALQQQLQDPPWGANSTWPEPLLQAHAADIGARLKACHNPLQAWQLSTWASACLALESDWQRLLVTAITLPLRAAAAVVLIGDTLRPGLAKAVDVAHQLTGLGPRAQLGHRELQRRLQQHLAPRLDGRQGDRPVGPGEAGADLLAPLAGWLAMRVARTGADAATLCRDLPAALTTTLDELGLHEPEAQTVSVELWSRRVPFADWPALMTNPPRPEVPGLPLPPASKGPA